MKNDNSATQITQKNEEKYDSVFDIVKDDQPLDPQKKAEIDKKADEFIRKIQEGYFQRMTLTDTEQNKSNEEKYDSVFDIVKE